jgi:hypothetical protein
MIVIASHDRADLIENLLSQLRKMDLCGNKILVVDTNSTRQGYLDQIEILKSNFPDVIFDRKDYTCWDSGAYLHAYKNYPSENYFFLQDSLSITNKNLIVEWSHKLDKVEVAPMFNFPYAYDSGRQRDWAEEGIDFDTLPKYGIFGPIFGVTKKALDMIPDDWHREPNEKEFGCGMERRWSLMFHALGCSKEYVNYLEGDHFSKFWTSQGIPYRKHIKKFWPGRH